MINLILFKDNKILVNIKNILLTLPARSLIILELILINRIESQNVRSHI